MTVIFFHTKFLKIEVLFFLELPFQMMQLGLYRIHTVVICRIYKI